MKLQFRKKIMEKEQFFHESITFFHEFSSFSMTENR